MSSNNNAQNTDQYAKLDDEQQQVMYSSIDTTGSMSGSFYQQQVPPHHHQQGTIVNLNQPPIQQPLPNVVHTTTTTVNPPQKSVLDSLGDSFTSMVNSISLTPTTEKNPAYLRPQFIPTTQNPESVFEYTLDAGILDCQLNHPTQLGQVSSRIIIELMVQSKINPNLSQKIGKAEIGGNAAYRADLKLHILSLDAHNMSEQIDTLIQADPQKSLQNFFVYVIVKRVKSNILDVQKFPIAFSPCFTLADFVKKDTNQAQLFSFDLYKDQQLRENVGKLGIRLSVTAYSDFEYIKSLPVGLYASKVFNIPCTSKSKKVASLLQLTEKVKTWLNTYSSMVKVIELTTANDGREIVQVVLYQKL